MDLSNTTFCEYLRSGGIPPDDHIIAERVLDLCDFVFRPIPPFQKWAEAHHHKFVKKIPAADSVIMCWVDGGNLKRVFQQCARHPRYTYIVINAPIMNDGIIDRSYLERIPDNVRRVYGKNILVKHPRFIPMPSGRDFRNKQCYNSPISIQSPAARDGLLYSNFAIRTNPTIRGPIHSRFCDKPWVTSVAVTSSRREYPITREQYIHDLSRHKFCLSPPGVGPDCFRTWQALYYGCIPIVQGDPYHRMLHGLPLLLTQDYSELSPAYLNQKYEDILNQHYYLNTLSFRHWKEQIAAEGLTHCGSRYLAPPFYR